MLGIGILEVQNPVLNELLKEKRIRLGKQNTDIRMFSLKILCFEIIRNKCSQVYTEWQKISGAGTADFFNKLPNTLKSDLLLGWRKWGSWEHFLANKDLSKLSISLNPTEHADAINNFRATLASKQFKLKSFTWSGMSEQEKFMNPSSLSAHMPLSIITSSTHFDALRNFSLTSFIVNDVIIKMIATHLKQLRVLHLSLSVDQEVSAEGISTLSALPYLRKFTFSPESRKVGNRVYNLCLNFLPELLVVGNEEFDHATYGSDLLDRKKCYFYSIDFNTLPTPTKLCFRQLLLSHDVGVIPDGVTMPNLTSLYLCNPLTVTLDRRFSNVTELGLVKLGIIEYLQLLKFLGDQLLRLLIHELEDDLQLDIILRLCPNLEELHIPETPPMLTFSSPLYPETDLQNLKVLVIKLTIDFTVTEFSPGVLVQLLSAPNLCHIRLESVDITNEDTEALVLGIQQGKILQKLEKFEFEHFNMEENGPWAEFKQELKNNYDRLLFNLAEFGPRFFYHHGLKLILNEK